MRRPLGLLVTEKSVFMGGGFEVDVQACCMSID
jgi:hypothetical protein